MILYVIVLHYAWAVLIFIYDGVTAVTALAAMRYIMPRPFVMIALTVAATLSLWSLFARSKWTAVLLMVPQQFFLFVGAGGAVEAMWEGHFADGVVRPHTFLIADQIHMVLTAICHSLAMYVIVRGGIWAAWHRVQ